MNTSKLIRAVVGGGRYTTTAPIMKEDHGIYLKIEGLELPETYEIDFSNSRKEGTSVTMIGNADGVLIPTQFIKTGKDVFAFLYHVGEDYGKTVYTFCIPNHVRPDRTNEQPEPEQESAIDQAISALNTAVAQTAQDVLDADASAQSASASATSAADSASQAAESAQGTEEYAVRAEAAQTAAESAQSAAQTAAATATTKAAQASSAESAAASAAQTATAKAIEAAQIVEGVEGYAESAAQSASSAATSATTASTKASEASASASTASAKATEATTAAGTATTAKDDAVSAKTAAETAQAAAETAQGKAETAQAAAEAAKEATEEAIDTKAPVILETASGSIASFSDGADNMPMKSLVVDIEPVQSGSGDPSPDNVRPISGWDGVTAQRTGKNLLNPKIPFDDGSVYDTNSDGSITVYSTDTRAWDTSRAMYLKKGTYVASRSNPSGTCQIRDLLNNIGIGYMADGAYVSGAFTLASDCFVGFRLSGAGSYPYVTTFQLELGSTATDYEPYNGNTYSIDWQSEAGTVYGGTIDVISGELVVDRAMVDLGTFTWSTPISVNPNCFTARDLVSLIKGREDAICDTYTVLYGSTTSSAISSAADKTLMINKGNEPTTGNYPIGTIIVKDSDYASMTAAEFKDAMSGVQLVYELATPQTYQLTPTEVKSLLGQNNVWADTGDVAVEYRADTKLYIQRLTQPDTADLIADANIVSGQYFMVGNSLYKATANIANGGQIIVGTNCTRKSLSEALNEINS